MNWKSIILGILTLVFGFVFILITNLVFTMSEVEWWKVILYPSLAIIPFLSCWGLFLYLVKNRWINYALSLLFVITAIFVLGLEIGMIITLLIFLIGLAIAHYQVQSDIKSRIKLAFDKSTTPGVKTLFIVLAIIVATAFYYTPMAHLYSQGIKIPADLQTRILILIAPNYTPDSTVDELIVTLSGQKEDAKEILDKLPPEKLQEFRQQNLEQLGLSELNLQGEEKVSEHPEILETIIFSKIGPTWQKIAPFLPFLIALGIYEIAAILGYLIVPLAILLAFALYQLMRKLGWVDIKETPKIKEILQF